MPAETQSAKSEMADVRRRAFFIVSNLNNHVSGRVFKRVQEKTEFRRKAALAAALEADKFFGAKQASTAPHYPHAQH